MTISNPPPDFQTEQQSPPEVQAPQRGGRGLHKLKSQAGKLRSRLKSIQRPTFSFAQKKSKKPKSKPATPAKTTEMPKKTADEQSDEKPEEKKPSKMERLKMALPERSKFKLHFPDRAKFHIKKPNIHMPTGFSKKTENSEQSQQRSNESTWGSRKNIFSFATLPHIFEKKPKANVTESSKESQSQDSQEIATFPRVRKSTRWTEKFEAAKMSEDMSPPVAIDRSKPWRRPSLEEPRLSFSYASRRSASIEESSMGGEIKRGEVDEIRFMDYEDEDLKRSKENIDPRLYGDQTVHEESEGPKMSFHFPPIDSRSFDDREVSVPRSEEEGS